MALASVDNTILVDDGWANGSLSGLILQNQQNNSVYPGNFLEANINLTLFSDNIAAITFPVNDTSIQWAFPLAQSVFQPSNFRVGVWCSYPLSGQYDVLPRGLFYLLLIFSLLFRRHNWLATAALGTAMTYAATSAVHLLALVTNFDFGTPDDPMGWNEISSKAYGDVDLYGIYPILSAAAIMLTPILNWSVSVRANDAQMVVVYWGALVFAALIPAWIYNNYITPWWINELPSFALCPFSAAADHPDCNENIMLTTSSYDYCQCVDFCGLLGPATPMRKNANMVPFLSRPISNVVNNSGPLRRLSTFDEFVLAFIVVQGLLGLIESQFTQAEVRNLVFRALYAEPRDFIILLFDGQRQDRWLKKLGMQNPSPKTSRRWKFQYQAARLIAATFFATAIAFAIVCPAVFVTSVVTNEFYLTYYPLSEHSDAVGAWSIWVGAAFVIIAACIAQYHEAWMKSLRVAIQSSFQLIGYDTIERHQLFPKDEQHVRVRDRLLAFLSEISSPLAHAWHSTRRAYWTLSYTILCFVDWWRKPISMSKQTRREAMQLAEDAKAQSNLGRCPCKMCGRHKDEDEALEQKRKDSSFGERQLGKIEKGYTAKRLNRGEDQELEPISDYGLPRVTTSPSISMPLIGEDDSVAPARPRQTYARKNTDTSRPSTIHRKPVPSRPDSSQEDEILLPGRTSPEQIGEDENLHSGALAEHEEPGGVPMVQPRSPVSRNSGYDRLPSR